MNPNSSWELPPPIDVFVSRCASRLSDHAAIIRIIADRSHRKLLPRRDRRPQGKNYTFHRPKILLICLIAETNTERAHGRMSSLDDGPRRLGRAWIIIDDDAVRSTGPFSAALAPSKHNYRSVQKGADRETGWFIVSYVFSVDLCLRGFSLSCNPVDV